MLTHEFNSPRRRPVRSLLTVLMLSMASTVLAVAPAPPAAAATDTAQVLHGFARGEDLKEWFNTRFDFDAGRLGSIQGRIRFVTETSVATSATRTISTGVPRSFDAGQNVLVNVQNSPGDAQLVVRSRPALQILFEWQPQHDPLVCDVDTFPDLDDGEWFRRTDGDGPVRDGVCGAVEVTADDLNPILQKFGIDLELPEVFDLLDEQFTPQFTGTQTMQESHELFEIKVCKIASDFFGLPLGDRCGLQVNAVVRAPLTNVSQILRVQACTSAFTPEGMEIPCAVDAGSPRVLTYTNPSRAFQAPGVCPSRPSHYDARVSNVRWVHRIDDVSVGLSVDFNVRLTEGGEGWDLASIDIPGSISLIDDPIDLDMRLLPVATVLHVGQVTADDDPPTAAVVPQPAAVDEGSTVTLAAQVSDLCTPVDALDVRWTIDGAVLTGPSLSRTYTNDLPTPTHDGIMAVTDQAGNQASAGFRINVRNVPPALQLSGFPSQPIPIGTTLQLATQVADPGEDVVTWNWSFGDGTNVSRQGANAQDRADNRTHTYAAPGVYTLQVGVHDGTDLRSAGGQVVVFDPLDRLVGSGTFIADSSSINVPVGSSYSVGANVSYPQGAVRPSGPFSADFLIDIGANETVPAHLAATSYDWLFETGSQRSPAVVAQGTATLNGEAGWKFEVLVTRDSLDPNTARVTVSVWRPGITSLANPDYRFGGPRDTGNLL